MLRKSLSFFFLIISFLFSATSSPTFAAGVWPVLWNQHTEKQSTDTDTIKAAKTPLSIKPIIGLGTGMLSFMGDYNENHVVNPQYGRIGFDLSVTEKVLPYLQVGFTAMFGKLAANEHQAAVNLNFESQIRTGGIEFQYNFDNFFKNKERKMSPYVSVGFESFEFLTKTNLYDNNGNTYYYWTDGTIRNMDQQSANAANAKIIQRNYNYESDVRALNKNGFGRYPENSFAVPVGIGALFHLSPRVDFKIGTTIHYTFTDYIDGIPVQTLSKGPHYDKFMMSSFQLRVDLFKKDDPKAIDPRHYDDVDFGVIATLDSDGDGVPDDKDSCQGTPSGVAVDLKGCPLDEDKDGVPDYLDKQPGTPAGSIVDKNGVAMSDSLIAENWDRFNDSTMKYANHEILPMSGNGGYHPAPKKKEYTVLLGTFKKGLSTEKMTMLLSIQDIQSTTLDDSSTVYSAGKFDNILDAEKRKKELVADGMTDARVVYKKGDKFLEPEKVFEHEKGLTEKSGTKEKEGVEDKSGTKEKSGSKEKSGTKEKEGIADKSGTKEKSGTKDKSGTKEKAGIKEKEGLADKSGTKEKEELNDKSGSKTGVRDGALAKDGGKTDVNADRTTNSSGVVFRIQLGAFKRPISKSTFSDAGPVLQLTGTDGLYKYFTGSFKTFDDAAKFKIELISKGFTGSFIAAFKDGKRVALTDVGAIPAPKRNPNDSDNVKAPAVQKDQIVFKVQIGAFKNEPPADIKAKFSTIKDVKQSQTNAGVNRYTAGSFSDYKEAQKFKDELKKKGIEGAFVIAFFKNELISVPEALELLKQ